jgi:Transposase
MSKSLARVFSREFKHDAVRRMEAGENVSALARELSLRRKLLYQWRDALRAGGAAHARAPAQGGGAGSAVDRAAAGSAGGGRRCGRAGGGSGAHRRARAQGRAAAAGAGFFQASLAASRGVTPAERRLWRDGVYALIQAMTRPQGTPPGATLPVDRMCALARRQPGGLLPRLAGIGAAPDERGCCAAAPLIVDRNLSLIPLSHTRGAVQLISWR